MGLTAVGDSTDPRTVVFSTAVIMAGASMARSTEIPATASAFPSITASPGGDPTGQLGAGIAVLSWVVWC